MSAPRPWIPSAPKARWFWPVLAVLVLTDCSTKELVRAELVGNPGPHSILGEWLRLTLAYNPDAALNLSFGGASRFVLSTIALGAIGALLVLYRKTAPDASLRAAALALLAGGAMGNLLDRLRSPRGVIDFIDIGIGDSRFWTFNVADIGVTIGALLLAVVFWREDARAEPAT